MEGWGTGGRGGERRDREKIVTGEFITRSQNLAPSSARS